MNLLYTTFTLPLQFRNQPSSSHEVILNLHFDGFIPLLQQLYSYPVLAEKRNEIAEIGKMASWLEEGRPGSAKEILRDTISLLILVWCGTKLKEHLPNFSVEDRPNVLKAISSIFVFSRLDALMSNLDLPDVDLPLPAGNQGPAANNRRFDRLTDTDLVFLVRFIYLLAHHEQELLLSYLRQMQETDNSRYVRLERFFLRQGEPNETN